MKGENEMKRSFKVATVFTGAVACATALAPTAEATTGTMNRITPDTTAGNCAANSGPALHVYYSKKEKHSLAACVKGDGFFAFGAGRKWSGICGGAYSGSFF